ncbi:hypothetical protein HK102_004308, partial [Quaeritorhiza haematococci]
ELCEGKLSAEMLVKGGKTWGWNSCGGVCNKTSSPSLQNLTHIAESTLPPSPPPLLPLTNMAKKSSSSKSSSKSASKSEQQQLGSSSSKQPKQPKQQKTSSTEPDFPVLLPSPKRPLIFIEHITDHIYTIPHFLSPAESRSIIEFAESVGFVPAEKNLIPKKGFAFRDNDRIQFDSPVIADMLWKAGLGRACTDAANPLPEMDGRKPVGLNSNIRLYKYSKGQRFGQHYDDSVRDFLGRETEFTVLIYLSPDGAVQGGETVFYKSKREVALSVAPSEGLLLLHRHGRSCLLHEGAEVTKGTKYLLRTDVVYG